MSAEFEELLAGLAEHFIVDDTSSQQKKPEFMPIVAEWQEKNVLSLFFFTEASVNRATTTSCLTTWQAGFQGFSGIETPVEESLKEAQKSQNRGTSSTQSKDPATVWK